MAFETIVTGKILNSGGIPVDALTVNFKAVKEQNPITGYRDTVTLFSGPTDTNGNIQFSGVSVGNYDVQVVSGSSSWTMENYQVKNTYTVAPGGSEIIEESRTFVRSGETLAPSGIMVNDTPRPNNKLGNPLDVYAEEFYSLGQISGTFTSPFNESEEFSVVTLKEREYGDIYWRGNQNLKHSQNFTFKLPA